MTSFAEDTFSHAQYATFRPTYPDSLYQTVLAYHDDTSHRGGEANSRHDSLLDLGCGHGLVARVLAPHFTTVTAIDPSPGMVAQARQLTATASSSSSNNITIRQASVEDLSFLPPASVDLAVAGTAAHWFDFRAAWPQLARVVRRGGSLAFWGYSDSLVVGKPQLREILLRHAYGTTTGEARPGEMPGLGVYWEEPGRSVLAGGFEAIKPPEEDWEGVKRVVLKLDGTTPTYGVERAPKEALWLRRRLTLGEYEVYARTWSSWNRWANANPGFKPRRDGGEGDVIDAMLDEFVEAVPEWKAKGDKWREIEVELVWATCLLMARRK